MEVYRPSCVTNSRLHNVMEAQKSTFGYRSTNTNNKENTMSHSTNAKITSIALKTIKDRYDYPCIFFAKGICFVLQTPNKRHEFQTFPELMDAVVQLNQFFETKMYELHDHKINFTKGK